MKIEVKRPLGLQSRRERILKLGDYRAQKYAKLKPVGTIKQRFADGSIIARVGVHEIYLTPGEWKLAETGDKKHGKEKN